MRSTLLLLMLMFQLQPNPLANDDGLDYARELGLVAQTELQATDNGYNFTITEIYADANRVTFTFEIDEPTSMGESIGFRPTLINGSDTEDDTAVVRRVERFEAPYTETATFRTPSALDGVAPYTLRVVAQQRTETLAEVTFSGELLLVPGEQTVEVDEIASESDVDVRLTRATITDAMLVYEVCYPPVAEDGFYRPIGSVETSLSTVRIRHRPAHLFGETETCQEHYALTAYDGGEIIIHIRGLNYWRPSQREEPDIIGPWAWTIRPPGGVPLPPTVQVEQTPFDATTMPPTPTPAPEPDTGPVPTN